MAKLLDHLENDYLDVTIHEDASLRIRDRRQGQTWQAGPVAIQEQGPIDVGHVWLRQERSVCEQFAGRFSGKKEGDGLRFTLYGRLGREVGTFRCRFELDRDSLLATIVEIDEALPSLVFPTPLESESLVFPSGVGRWLREPLNHRVRYFWKFRSHLNMRWFGGLKGDRGWLAIVEQGHTKAGVLAANMTAAPGWMKSLGKWKLPVSVRYRFVDGGYVGLAKAFRAWTREHGLFKTLAEKIEENPRVANLVGGRHMALNLARPFYPERHEDRLMPIKEPARRQGHVAIHFTFGEARAMFEEARALAGPGKGLCLIRGWIKGGYDESHPDIWPPEPCLGNEQELRQALDMPKGFVGALHDNYLDMYAQNPSFPRGVNIMANGDPMPAGLWAGGQAYVINSRNALAYAERNWEMTRKLEPTGMFIDTTTAMEMHESYEQDNTLTSLEDEVNKAALLRFYKDQGMVLGSEEGTDFGVPYIDWLENRHQHQPGGSIPLWPLVFHDAACCCRYVRNQTNWLPDLLWGYMLIWNLGDRAGFEAAKPFIQQAAPVDQWHARIATAEMIDHRYLDNEGLVEQTAFATGDLITVNFADQTRTVEGRAIPARGYVMH